MSDLARALHASRTTVSLWERGRRCPARHYWPGLAATLRLQPSEVAALFADHPPARHDGLRLPSLAPVRRRSGLTQRAVATALGVAPTTLSMWETAGVRVPRGVAHEIARLLDTDLGALTASPSAVADGDARPLRRLRRSAGMSQREAAAHLGIAMGTLARYEAGERPTPIPVVRRMAVVYRCPAARVLRSSGTRLTLLPIGARWTPADVPHGIRAARTAAGMTKAALGRAVGRSGQAVHGWETGRRRPGTVTCRRLEVLLGLGTGRLPY